MIPDLIPPLTVSFDSPTSHTLDFNFSESPKVLVSNVFNYNYNHLSQYILSGVVASTNY